MQDMFRLTPQVYEKLEQMLPKPMVTGQTTDQMIGYLLGIQYVLSVLREGFTIGSDTPPSASFQTGTRSLRRNG